MVENPPEEKLAEISGEMPVVAPTCGGLVQGVDIKRKCPYHSQRTRKDSRMGRSG